MLVVTFESFKLNLKNLKNQPIYQARPESMRAASFDFTIEEILTKRGSIASVAFISLP